ncbi:SH3 domain-containing protein [Thalassomonas viridans]|uniref:SH3 domain-containing protein n=1 Tax=Thalassomonas viridans TaxID=137584 RepID=A0AAE9YYQ9_9GAMM|nr:SH3 domain-containing protein [Thalassomonas viridans]WDE02829.1 SH3 domain-containing protein [Thalassomonas viridans]
MKNAFHLKACAAVIALILTGCESIQSDGRHSQEAGGEISAKHQTLWTSYGAFAGSVIGKQLSKYLDKQDFHHMTQATSAAVALGQGQSWINPQTNTRGEARVVSTENKADSFKIPVLKQRIDQVPPLDIIGQTYHALKKSNVRGGPGTRYQIVSGLAIGEAVNVIGKVRDSNWYLISKDGIGRGFIYAPLLEAAPAEKMPDSGISIAQEEIEEKEVTTNRICRTIEQSVSFADGSLRKDTIKACQSPSGWQVKA